MCKRTVALTFAVMVLAGLAPQAQAQLGTYVKDGNLSNLKIGTYYWGEQVTAQSLRGKVVVIQLAGT